MLSCTLTRISSLGHKLISVANCLGSFLFVKCAKLIDSATNLSLQSLRYSSSSWHDFLWNWILSESGNTALDCYVSKMISISITKIKKVCKSFIYITLWENKWNISHFSLLLVTLFLVNHIKTKKRTKTFVICNISLYFCWDNMLQ